MARDTLQVLLAMRRRSVEQARYALGICLAAEAEVAERIRSLEDSAQRDRETSGVWQDAHQFLEMSAVRLTTARAERHTMADDLAAAAVRSGEARDVVTAARTAAEAVEQLISERTAASQVTAARREQHVLDDIARMHHAVRGRHEVG
jgi:flagellar biosynthesis chaperone FliJ